MKKIFKINKLYASLIGVIAVFLVATSYLITQTLDTPLLNRPDKIIVELPSTGGVFESASVTYRGMKIGKISDVRLNDKGMAEVTATITNPIKIPANSPIKVRSLSPVGEQYLDFQPTSNEGPYLRNGSRVQATAEDLPKTLASTVVNVSKVLDQLDKDDLRTALQGIGTALNGTGDDIGRIADQGYDLLQTIDANFPLIDSLLDNGQTLLQVGVDNAQNIQTIAQSSAQVAAFLKSFDPEFRKLLANGPGQFKQLQGVISAVNEVIPQFLDRTIKVTNILVARDAHLRELLRSYALGITTLGSAFYDGALRGHLELVDRYSCDYGGPKYAPTDTTTRPLWPNGQCNAPANRVVRGAKNAPKPTG